MIPSLFVPPSGIAGNVLAVAQLGVIAGSFFQETTNPTPYSKFAAQSTAKLPSRQGMLLIYTPSALLAAGLDFFQNTAASTTTLAGPLVTIHFLKRVLESAFLHKYSGNMDAGTSVGISSYYCLVTALLVLTAQPIQDVLFSTATSISSFTTIQKVGMSLFILGEVGNLYHHYILRQLRNNNNNSTKDVKRYIAPTGGLFQYAAAPHYLFEIIAFLGIACTSQSIHALLVALGMTSYLAGRAKNTNDFYMEKFSEKEWSRSKKALIPFLF